MTTIAFSPHRFGLSALVAILVHGCGGEGGGGSMPSTPAPSLSLEVLAGIPFQSTRLDGPAASATFDFLRGIAVDPAGTVFVSDFDNRNIRAIDANGMVRTVAGGSTPTPDDGPAATAGFTGPIGLARDAAGNLYIADTYNHRIRRMNAAGLVTTFAGTGLQGSDDGPAMAASFHSPWGLTLDADGNLFVADSGNATIRRISRDGIVSTVAGAAQQFGSNDGPATEARFTLPTGLAVDPQGNVVIADAGNARIRKLMRSGVVVTYGGGALGSPSYSFPTGVAVDSAGTIFVADYGSHVITRVYPDSYQTHAGIVGNRGLADGVGPEARFFRPAAIAFGPTGDLLVADSGNRRVRSISSGIPRVTTLAGSEPIGAADGTGTAARFSGINAMAADGAGNLLVSDSAQLRNVTPSGHVVTVTNLPGTTLSLTNDGSGNAIVAASIICGGRFTPGCTGGNDYLRITPQGEKTLLHHTGGFVVKSVARDATGGLYLTQWGGHSIYKVTSGPELSIFAGASQEAGLVDGPREQARFSNPGGIAFDAANNLYVADAGNGALRRIPPAGEVTTIGRFPASQQQPATMHIALDSARNVYIADSDAHVVRKVTPAGIASVLVGVEGVSGVATGALPASLNRPLAIAVVGKDLYIANPYAIMVVRNIQ